MEAPLEDPPSSDGQFETRARAAQGSLFPSDDFILPESVGSMRKAISAIHAMPIKAEQSHTLTTRRLMDACILVAQLDYRKRGREQIELMRTNRASPLFETRVTEFAKLAGMAGKNYERVRDGLDALYEMTLQWNVVGEDANVEWEMKSHFLASLGYGTGEKRGLIRFSIDPAILEIVLEPSHWATLSLQAMKGLSTPASYALYQNAWRYINTRAKVTAALPTETWIKLIVGPSRYIKEDSATGRSTVQYGDFKRRVLLEAMELVNQVEALDHTLELKEYFSGNRVAKLQFKFIPKQQRRLDMPVSWPPEVLDVLAGLGFDAREIADMSQSRSYEEVAESLVRLKASDERMKAAGRPITSRKAYFIGILSNVAAGASVAEISDEDLEKEVREQEAVAAAKEREAKVKEAFARHQTQVANASIFALPPGERAALFAEFEASPKGAKSQILWGRGWTPNNVGALSIFRAWLQEARPDHFEKLLPNPEDRTIEAWSAWRLDQLASENEFAPNHAR